MSRERMYVNQLVTPKDATVEWGPAAPTMNKHRIGSVVFNTAPAAGGTVGWVCTATGTPGTWKTFGAIAA